MFDDAGPLFSPPAMPQTPVSRKELRPHQRAAIDKLRHSFSLGNRRAVIQGPTGFGKTLVAAKIIERALEKRNRVLFTVPQINLVDQTIDAFAAEGIRDIGVMQANHRRRDPLARVQIASVQTLDRRGPPDDIGLVIVDECHIRSRAVEQLMDETLKGGFFVGLSATPWARGMGRRWQDLVIPTTISELIAGGYLSAFTAFAPDVPDLSRVKVERGEFAEAALEDVMGDAKILGNVVSTWLERGGDRPTLAFAVNRAHAGYMADAFERAGIATAYVDGKTDAIEREAIRRQFRNGEIRVICSVRTMTTGVDLPVSCIIDAAPTRSEMLHVQKIGRGLRVNEGTEDCLILDHAGNSLRLGLVTEIHHDKLDATRPGERQVRVPAVTREKLPEPCTACGVVFSGGKCPACGHERKPPPTAAAEGELVELTPSGAGAKPDLDDPQRFYSMALWVDAERPDAAAKRPGGYAFVLFREKFGRKPTGLRKDPEWPSRAFRNYIQARRDKFRREQKKREAAL